MIWQSQQKDFSVFPGLFHSGAGAGDTAGMHLPVYKMNFPRKNPMKMAAMTTRREGREAVLASRPRRLVEFVVTWSERGTFLILIPSSCDRGRGERVISEQSRKQSTDQHNIGQLSQKPQPRSPETKTSLKTTMCHFHIGLSDPHPGTVCPICPNSNRIHPIKFKIF